MLMKKSISKQKNGLTFHPFTIFQVFKKLFSNLVNDLVQKLPAEAEDYYHDMFNLNAKRLTLQTIQNKIHLRSSKKLRHKQSCRI